MRIRALVPNEIEVDICLMEAMDAMFKDITSETNEGVTVAIVSVLKCLELVPDKAIADLKGGIRATLHNAILNEAKRWEAKPFCEAVEK